MKHLKLIALAFGAFFVGGLREQFCTANVNDRGVSPGDRPKNEMVELLCKGAGIDPEDVYWRVSRGLSPKQAVDVAAQEKFEAEVEALAKKHKGKEDSEIRDLAKKAGIDNIQDLSRQQLLIALARAERATAGTPMPGESGAGPAAAEDLGTFQRALAGMTEPQLREIAVQFGAKVKPDMSSEELVAAIMAVGSPADTPAAAPAGKKPAGKKPAGKKPAGKKPRAEKADAPAKPIAEMDFAELKAEAAKRNPPVDTKGLKSKKQLIAALS